MPAKLQFAPGAVSVSSWANSLIFADLNISFPSTNSSKLRTWTYISQNCFPVIIIYSTYPEP